MILRRQDWVQACRPCQHPELLYQLIVPRGIVEPATHRQRHQQKGRAIARISIGLVKHAYTELQRSSGAQVAPLRAALNNDPKPYRDH